MVLYAHISMREHEREYDWIEQGVGLKKIYFKTMAEKMPVMPIIVLRFKILKAFTRLSDSDLANEIRSKINVAFQSIELTISSSVGERHKNVADVVRSISARSI